MKHTKYNQCSQIFAEIAGAALKRGITQYVLVLSLFCNPMAGLAVAASSISDFEYSAITQMPCQTNSLQTQSTNDEEVCTMDCCNADDGCSMDQSCHSCLNLNLVSPMLLETLDICFSHTVQKNLELSIGYLSNRSILPELHPPASFYLS